MNTYLTAWFAAVVACVTIGLAIGLWSTFRKDGKTYTRKELFYRDTRNYFGVASSIPVALAVLFSIPSLSFTCCNSTWLGGPVTMSAIVVLVISLTGLAAYVGMYGAFFFGYAVKSVIVALQIHCEKQRAEIAAGVTAKLSELDAAADNKKVIRFSDATQASNQ